MVHALAESYRVLKTGGRLVDLRPYSSGWPLDVVTPNTQMLAGPLDDSIGQSVDVASDDAILEAVQRGWFQKENKTSFQYAYYWDTVDDMHEFLKANWEESATVPDSVLSKAHRLVQTAGKPAQIRIRKTMSLASYRKLAEHK